MPDISGPRISATRQNDTTNTSNAGNRIEVGWGYIAHLGGTNNMNEPVTFSAAFTNVPVIIVSFAGDSAAGTTLGSGGTNLVGKMVIKHGGDTTTGFNVRMDTGDGANAAAGNYFYTWMAIGV